MRPGRDIVLTSRFDGAVLSAYGVAPNDARRGGLVVIHDLSGITDAIRDLCDDFAEDGYEVIAPDLSGRQAWDQVEGDLQAAIGVLAAPVNVVGYGWGGTAAWLAACRCEGVAAVSSFYGAGLADLMAETPRRPTILHFSKRDAAVPLAVIDQIAAAHPDMPIHLYDADSGFAFDRASDSARLARLRTLQLFQRSSGVRAEV